MFVVQFASGGLCSIRGFGAYPHEAESLNEVTYFDSFAEAEGQVRMWLLDATVHEIALVDVTSAMHQGLTNDVREQVRLQLSKRVSPPRVEMVPLVTESWPAP
jgi:hypothetical protein